MLSSGQWTSSGGAWGTSVSSPFGASFWRELGFPPEASARWRDVDLASFFREAAGLPLFVENDASAAAAAELVFGVSSGSGGLGWYIFEQKNQLLIPNVFAGLLTVILFGLIVENLIFRTIENRTVRRWGMQV